MATDFYSQFGFTSNPFENNTAEREPNIAAYAVRPPYLDRVLATSSQKGIFVLAGSRGSGKSATRLTVSKILWNENPKPLVVTLSNFNVFRPYAATGAPLELFANQLTFLAIEQILSWLSSLEEDDREKIISALKAPERDLVRRLVGTFYLNRPDHSRNVSATDCFATLDISIIQKSQLWADKRWDQLVGVVSTLATRFGEKYFEVDLGNPSSYQELFKRQHAQGFGDPLYTFSKIVELARVFGFSGVLVHVDKVDETEWTANNIQDAARLIYPMLANIQLHEIDGLTWAFFLWDKVSEGLTNENGFPIRWDKIPNGEVNWSEKYLRELIEKRLYFFSNGAHSSLQCICEEEFHIDEFLPKIFQLAEYSPRSLITLLDVAISQHIQANQGQHSLVQEGSMHLGMDEYAKRSLANSGHTVVAAQIAKLQALVFNSKDVGSRFGIGPQAARARIDGWLGLGLVEYFESKVGPDGGRPVDHFTVSDPRLKRYIERGL